MKICKLPTVLVLWICIASADAKTHEEMMRMRPLTPDQSAMVDRAIQQENRLMAEVQKRTPIVETYIQDTRPDAKLQEKPVADYYMLSRVDFAKGFFARPFDAPSSPRSEPLVWKIASNLNILKALGGHYLTMGFIDNMFMDETGVRRSDYVFSFVRKEFLGSVRTWVFDVEPRESAADRFEGRIWVEDRDANIVRLNGVLTQAGRVGLHKEVNFHFDCWRTNVQPGLWLPTAIFVEEAHRTGRRSPGLKAQTYVWGYSLNSPARESENVSLEVENAVDESKDAKGRVTPLEASRDWVIQAENNVLDRLIDAGLVAPARPDGYESKVLDQIVTNLEVPNNLAFANPVHCRVLLVETVEATTAGNTILLSKGLLDSLPSEESIASVIALELAHIELGHHMDTRYAFNDRLLFPDEESFQEISIRHTEGDNEAAAKRAMVYLRNSMYKDKLANAGLYWEQLAERGKVLKQLNTPRLGDSLLRPDGAPWMTALAAEAPKINWDNTAQVPALPLESWLTTNPWNDTVTMIKAERFAPMNAREKMPFEVTPVFFNLHRDEASQPEQAGAPGSQPAMPAAIQAASGATVRH